MDYAKEYDRMVEQSNRQQEELEQLRSALREAKEVLDEYANSVYECVKRDFKSCCNELDRNPHAEGCGAMKAIATINKLLGEE